MMGNENGIMESTFNLTFSGVFENGFKLVWVSPKLIPSPSRQILAQNSGIELP